VLHACGSIAMVAQVFIAGCGGASLHYRLCWCKLTSRAVLVQAYIGACGGASLHCKLQCSSLESVWQTIPNNLPEGFFGLILSSIVCR
jgi:hypothetical protein